MMRYTVSAFPTRIVLKKRRSQAQLVIKHNKINLNLSKTYLKLLGGCFRTPFTSNLAPIDWIHANVSDVVVHGPPQETVFTKDVFFSLPLRINRTVATVRSPGVYAQNYLLSQRYFSKKNFVSETYNFWSRGLPDEMARGRQTDAF